MWSAAAVSKTCPSETTCIPGKSFFNGRRFDHTAIGEDMDLTIRLHRLYRERRQPYRIAYEPDPLWWTQAPEDLASLRSQRTRWRRGFLQVIARNGRMIGNPRYGAVGLFALPYLAFFEGLGPLFEVGGYALTTAAALSVGSLLENLGYRQLTAWWGCVGTWQSLRGGGGTWGSIKRKDLAHQPVARV
jgi:hypothetical protein